MKSMRIITILVIGWGWLAAFLILYAANEIMNGKTVSEKIFLTMLSIVILSAVAIYLAYRYVRHVQKQQEESTKRRYLEQIKQLQRNSSYTK